MLRRLKKGAYVLNGTIREIKANFIAVQLYPFGMFERDPQPRVHSKQCTNPCPVILVHGIIHNRSAFVSYRRKMARLGWENIYTINYSTFNGNVLAMVEQLSRKVDAILKDTGAKQIDIVAHSLGGIVARTFMSLGEGRGKVRKLVTLGTPHQGTHLSFIAKGLSRGALDADLRVNSFLIRLLTSTALPKNSEIVSIYSPFDLTVLPTENASAKGVPESAFKNIRLEYTGHTGLLYSQEAFDAVVRAILDGC
jgi:triacylglycerol lipase